MSIAAHLAILATLVSARPSTPPAPPLPIIVSLVQPPAPAQPAPKPAQAKGGAPKAGRPRATATQPAPPRSVVKPLHRAFAARAVEVDDDPPAPSAELTEAQLADAMTAGGGGSGSGSGQGAGAGGGACDMIRLVQRALRKDPLVQAAVAQAHDPAASSGKAYLVWNGDWVRSSSEAGKGLAAVREAIMWEVAFAPAACRAEPVHGLVLLSMNDAPGSVRLAVGAANWRWSSLLTPHGGP